MKSMMRVEEPSCKNLEVSSRAEWLLTNGLGGFSMGTVSGVNTRRYHGILVAATDPPATRMVLLAAIDCFVQTDAHPIGLSANQYPGAVSPQGFLYNVGFEVDRDQAVWHYATSDIAVKKTVRIHQGVNAVTVRYKNEGEKPIALILRPFVCHKFYHANFSESADYPSKLSFPKNGTDVEHQGILLHLQHEGAQRSPVQGWYYRFEHARETERGLDPRDDLFCPCELHYELNPGEEAVIVASTTENVSPIEAKEFEGTEFRLTPMLRSNVVQFLVKTESRTSLIAGYPWFTDWGRDTMISIPGALVGSKHFAEAKQILRDYAGQRHMGLIPNRFVERGEHPDYNTVDATLWFANAVYKVLEAEWDDAFAAEMADVLEDIFNWHLEGTLFGIKVDPADGLLSQGQEGVQLTWMDAKVGDWVVTPRHGKPVEICGLWINALRVMEWLAKKLGKDATRYADCASLAESNFDTKFWHEHRGHYLDTVDPDDASLRPNQVIAMALPFAPAKGDHAVRAFELVTTELFTPVGLRTLGPQEPGYKGRYEGPLPNMDACYHQGTAWPWLLGPYVTALVKLKGDKAEARKIVREAKAMLAEYGLGGLAEVYDGDQPQRPNGCPWQAWSAAELLRAWLEDCEGEEE